MTTEVVVRPAEPRDIAAITGIYAHHVRTGLATFEIDPPEAPEMLRRFEAIRAMGFPYLVAELDGVLSGYAYATLYRERVAYRFTLEDSIYVDAGRTGRGIGRALLSRLIAECEAIGCRQLVAVIGDSANRASIEVHEALGFRMAGNLASVGFKFGRWVDSVFMQRPIGAGDRTVP